MTNKNTSSWQLIIQTLAMVSQLGLTMLGNIAVAFFVGRLIDHLLGYSFFITPIFLVGGVLTGFWSVYRLVKKFIQRRKEDD